MFYWIVGGYVGMGLLSMGIHHLANLKVRDISVFTSSEYANYMSIYVFLWFFRIKQLLQDIESIRNWYMIRNSVKWMKMVSQPGIDTHFIGYRLSVKSNFYPFDLILPDSLFYLIFYLRKG